MLGNLVEVEVVESERFKRERGRGGGEYFVSDCEAWMRLVLRCCGSVDTMREGFEMW